MWLVEHRLPLERAKKQVTVLRYMVSTQHADVAIELARSKELEEERDSGTWDAKWVAFYCLSTMHRWPNEEEINDRDERVNRANRANKK